MLKEQLLKEGNRNALKSFNVLDEELIKLLSGEFSAEDYPPGFDFERIDKYCEKIEELKPIKIEEIEIIESDFKSYQPEKREGFQTEKTNFDETQDESEAEKEEILIIDTELGNFRPEKEKVETTEPERERNGENRQVELGRPSRLSKYPETSNISESRDDFGYMELENIPRDHISKEVKLIKSLTDKLSRDSKKSNAKAPLSDKVSEKSALPALSGEKSEAENKPSPSMEKKPDYPKPKKVKTEAQARPPRATLKENEAPLADFQLKTTEEDVLGIPFDVFDLSDFKLDDIIGGDGWSDDILDDEDLTRELYGDGSVGEADGMEDMDIDAVGGVQFDEKTIGVLKKETPNKSPGKKSSDKFPTNFYERLNEIIEETVMETVENSLNDLLPQIIEKVIHKKFSK